MGRAMGFHSSSELGTWLQGQQNLSEDLNQADLHSLAKFPGQCAPPDLVLQMNKAASWVCYLGPQM